MYKRYKGQESSYVSQVHNYARMKKFGLITRITMLIIPGIAFFIFLPACLFSYFEDWPYVTSVYYSFITLTTIGFGDYVPTFQNGQVNGLMLRGLLWIWYSSKMIAITFRNVSLASTSHSTRFSSSCGMSSEWATLLWSLDSLLSENAFSNET